MSLLGQKNRLTRDIKIVKEEIKIMKDIMKQRPDKFHRRFYLGELMTVKRLHNTEMELKTLEKQRSELNHK